MCINSQNAIIAGQISGSACTKEDWCDQYLAPGPHDFLLAVQSSNFRESTSLCAQERKAGPEFRLFEAANVLIWKIVGLEVDKALIKQIVAWPVMASSVGRFPQT